MRKFIGIIICIFAIFTEFRVYAAETLYASITISPVGVDGGNISDGKFTVYKVAELKDGILVYEDDFEACGIVLEDLSDTNISNSLDFYVRDNVLTGITAVIGDDGTVTIGGANSDIIDYYSLYLIRNTVASTGYEEAIPCILFVSNETAEGSTMISGNTWTVEVIPKLTPASNEDDGDTSGNSSEDSSSSDNSSSNGNSSEDIADSEMSAEGSTDEKIKTGIINDTNDTILLLCVSACLLVVIGITLISKKEN